VKSNGAWFRPLSLAASIWRITPDNQRAQNSVKTIQDGQCGLCTHFGESHPSSERLVRIRTSHDGPEDLVDECGHPRHASLHLKVTPISGCDGFEPAPPA
jgi:hypothetical protein